MKTQVSTSLRMALATLVLTGLAYPLLITGVAQVIFPHRAGGSLVTRDGRAVGSALIGQAFTRAAYLQGRPSAAEYDAAASGGANLGPTSRRLRERVAAEVLRLQAENPEAGGPVPVELVTMSASGLDPHLSPRAALWQAPRIAAARQLPVVEVTAVIRRHVEPRTLGVLGEPRVNVLAVNLALDRGQARR